MRRWLLAVVAFVLAGAAVAGVALVIARGTGSVGRALPGPSAGPSAPDRTVEPSGPPRAGAPGAGDEYYPGLGNGGYDVRHYTLRLRYDPSTDGLSGRATIDATATHALSQF